jgi:hypothetical protein
MVTFETREGQPEISYEDQNIPTPIGMPPFELFNNEKFAKLISFEWHPKRSGGKQNRAQSGLY